MPPNKPPSQFESFGIEGLDSPKRVHRRKHYGCWRLLGSLLVGLITIPVAFLYFPFVFLIALGETMRELASAIHKE